MNIQLIILSFFLYKLKANEIGDDNEWLKFKTENSKNYTQTEEKIRRKIWNENVLKIREMNGKQGNLKFYPEVIQKGEILLKSRKLILLFKYNF